jgi:hypothetical protein
MTSPRSANATGEKKALRIRNSIRFGGVNEKLGPYSRRGYGVQTAYA